MTTRTQIESILLSLGTVTTTPTAGLPYLDTWTVVAQDPAAGTVVPVGSPVNVTVIDPPDAPSPPC